MILMDATVATGAAAIMAIRILLVRSLKGGLTQARGSLGTRQKFEVPILQLHTSKNFHLVKPSLSAFHCLQYMQNSWEVEG